jgi:predicted RNA-binding Zn ribbon-like protein
VNEAALVVSLANARARRRPPHARAAVAQDALANATSATEFLERFLDAPVDDRELPAVRALQRAVLAIVDALIDGTSAPVDALNELAARAPVVYALEPRPDGGLDAKLCAPRTPVSGTLVHTVIRELGELDPKRLRRCARPECTLVFYDATRSGTQRWHAESPCGLQQRQRRHRARLDA